MSEIQTKGQILLENLQRRIYQRMGRKPREIDINFLREFLKGGADIFADAEPDKKDALMESLLKEMMSELSSSLPTKFEDPMGYSIIKNLSNSIEKSIDEFSIELPIKPLIGTMPTGRVNAMAISVSESSEYLVIFEDQIFLFALLLSKVLAQSMPIIDGEKGGITFSINPDDAEKIIQDNKTLQKRFADVVLAYLLAGQPGQAEQYFLNEPHQTLSSILINSMELFVMGHEYGHIIKGHLSAPQSQATLLGQENVVEISREWQQEFEADAVGLQLMIRSMQRDHKMDLSLSYWGADFFFSCNEILDRGVSILSTGSTNYRRMGSHPDANLRREFIRHMLEKSLPKDTAQGPIKLGQQVQRIMEILWERTEPILLDIYKRGAEPASIWR